MTGSDIFETEGMKVAVTGASGFIGGRLVEWLCLRRNTRPVAVVRTSSPRYFLAPFSCEVRTADLAEPASLQAAFAGCDTLVHCAFDFSPPDRTILIEQNLIALYNVVRAARDAGIQRLVYLSSAAVYGYQRQGLIDESTPYESEPDSYAEAKQKSEALLDLLVGTNGPSTVILQPGIVYGPRAYWATSFAEYALKGQVILPDSGMGVCNAVYVDDVIEAIMASLTHLPDVHLQRYLVVGPSACTWREYADCFLKAYGQGLVQDWHEGEKQAQRVSLLSGVLKGLYMPVASLSMAKRLLKPVSDWIKVRLSASSLPARALLPIFADKSVYSGTKAQTELSYTAKYSLDEGMALTIAWLRFARLLGENEV